MAALNPPVCEFNTPAPAFRLPDTEGKLWDLEQARGENGLLVMFICNHCPYVQAILPRLVQDVAALLDDGINTVAIMSNDIDNYPDDAPENMQKIALIHNFSFPYLIDAEQTVARDFGAVCTPDFFGYNRDLKLQYRGRFDDTGMGSPKPNAQHELLNAMRQIAQTQKGPTKQTPSIGCSIKWK